MVFTLSSTFDEEIKSYEELIKDIDEVRNNIFDIDMMKEPFKLNHFTYYSPEIRRSWYDYMNIFTYDTRSAFLQAMEGSKENVDKTYREVQRA